MLTDTSIKLYLAIYRALLSLYPKRFREHYAESMLQTFTDMCRERRNSNANMLSTVVWMFLETIVTILKENTAMILSHDFARRMLIWTAVVGLILMIPLVAMQFTTEVDWTTSDFVFMGLLLFACALMYEFVAMQGGITYRIAVGLGVITAFLLTWINLAVGIIGSEDNPANALYLGVIIIGMLGVVLSRMKPRGMSVTLWTVAAYQFAVPFLALAIWRPDLSSPEDGPGVFGVIMLNSILATMFASSAILFARAHHRLVSLTRDSQHTR